MDDFRQVIDLDHASSDDTVHLARTAAEAVRGLNWLTGNDAGLGQALSQLRIDAQTATGQLRLMPTSSNEENAGGGFGTVCPLSVVLGLQSHSHRPANFSFRPSSSPAAMARQVSELGGCLVVQRTGSEAMTQGAFPVLTRDLSSW